MLRTIQINSSNADNEELRRLYETAFPVQEQIPYDDLIHLLDAMVIDYTAYYDGEMLVGLTMVLRLPRYNWWWYFAVSEELRGKGYGQGILTSILDKYRDERPFILDIESPYQPDAPNPEQRRRRYAYYLRNGMKETPTASLMPCVPCGPICLADNKTFLTFPVCSFWDNPVILRS